MGESFQVQAKVLRHNDLLTKIRTVLGGAVGKFSSSYQDSTGRKLPCYYLPKREARLIAISSLELLAIINEMRPKGRAVLRHESLCRKIVKVLKGGYQKFLDTYTHPQNGQEYGCYLLPKREASLIAMSESFTVQAMGTSPVL